MSRLVNFAISNLLIVPCESAGGQISTKKQFLKLVLLDAGLVAVGGNASVPNFWHRATSPIFTSWRCGVMLRSNLMSGAEMNFCHFAQCLWHVQFDEFFGSLFYAL